mmetsp:Transcript_16355/g.49214  ORF Transcript_16355/g.49214 Transcript_16355/m.49214 type:complete len:220 (-) Transcript_16355:856-1515(-)
MRRVMFACTSQVSARALITGLVSVAQIERKYRSDAVRSFELTSDALSRISPGINAMSICRSSIGDAVGLSPSVRGIRCTFSSRSPRQARAPSSCHVENLLSLRNSAVIRRVVLESSSRPSEDSPSPLPLRCSASRVGKEIRARLRATHSLTPLPSSTRDFRCGSGCGSKPSSEGTPSARLLYPMCRCSRQGKTFRESRARIVSQVTPEPLSTRVLTLQK